MQKTIIVPASSTPTTVTVDIADPILQVTQQGGTPIVVEPPMVNPPTSGPVPADKKIVWQPDLTKPFNPQVDGQFRAGQFTNARIVDKDGAKALRLAVGVNDAGTSNGYRDEAQSFIADNGDMWYEFEQNFETLPTSAGNNGHSWQFHPDNNKGSATLSLWSEQGKFDIHINPTGGSSTKSLPTIGGVKSISAGKWYKTLLHVKWSATGGIVEMWIDGVKYINYSGPTTTTGVYFKMGINRWPPNTKDAVIYYRNIKIYK
jgi:polysaccharide lyase-like protein